MKNVAGGVADLTPEWLSYALGTDVRSVSAVRVGTGQTGTAYRLALDADGLPTSLVAKLAAVDESARQRVAVGYRAEVGFYRELAHTVDIRTPRCWYAAITDDDTAFTLLLEDLAPCRAGVQADGCSDGRAEAAVMNLAGLHAPRWNDESVLELAFLGRPNPERAAFLGQITRSATEGFVARYEADLDPGDIHTLRSCAAAIEAWQVAGIETLALVHGDYRLDNLMFDPYGNDVVAVDWQTLAVAPALRDVAYFLGTCLDIDQRRTTERDLVARYHAELMNRGVDGYGFERCFDDYRLGQLQAPMITTLGCMYATAERSNEADAMFIAMARRSCAAIRDLESLDLVQLA